MPLLSLMVLPSPKPRMWQIHSDFRILQTGCFTITISDDKSNCMVSYSTCAVHYCNNGQTCRYCIGLVHNKVTYIKLKNIEQLGQVNEEGSWSKFFSWQVTGSLREIWLGRIIRGHRLALCRCLLKSKSGINRKTQFCPRDCLASWLRSSQGSSQHTYS